MERATRNRWARILGVLVWVLPLVALSAGFWHARNQRIRAEQQLAAKSYVEAAIDELRDGANHGNLVIDANGTVLGWNEALERWTGWPATEIVGQSLERVMPPEQWEIHQREYLKFMGDRNNLDRPVRIVCWLLRRDGTRFPVEVNARSVKPPGMPLMSVALIDQERRIVDLTTTEAPR